MNIKREEDAPMGLRATTRITVFDAGAAKPGGFGPGCVSLLLGVAEERSLNKAAKRMGMAYSKAWRIVNEAEDQLGMKLLDRKGALGSDLTPEGRRALKGYLALQDEVERLVAERLPKLMG